MNKGLFPKLLPHLVAVVIFLLVAVIYCKPVLQGQVLQQHDVTQWKAMAQNSFEYKEKHGHFPLWTNGMFSGMPAYQIALESDNVVSPGWFYYILTLGLPKPISFFFLACVCFYFLSMMLRINPWVAIAGALAYAYATYNPIIIAAGHDTKMQSIALMPALVGSVILVYEGRYWIGAALTALFTALLVGMNHPQIAYYAFLILLFMTIGYAINWLRKGQAGHLAKALGIVAVTGAIGVLCNAVSLLTTYEYSKESIRGGSELATGTTNSTSTGLSADYALSYSMYKTEPFVMMVPKMYGGSNSLEVAQEESKAIAALQQMPQEIAQQLQYNLGAYWGGIGGTSGPPYVGAVICFLTLIGFFVLDTKHKWWILAASLLAIVMSWGSYFAAFNEFLLNYLPLYNKFRAPSMTIVIPTLLFCMMAIMTVQKVLNMENKEEAWDRYKKGLMLTGGVFIVLLLIYFSADFTSPGDQNLLSQVSSAPEQVQGYVRTFISALKEDRQDLFMSSLLRSFIYIALAAALLWLFIRKNISRTWLIAGIGLLAFIDVMAIDTQYLSSKNYQDDYQYQANFTPTQVDQQVMQDTTYYRVFDVRQGLAAALGSGYAAPSYFHNTVGGYHPAKLSIYQDLIEHQLSKFPQSLPVYNMLNTKYIIQKDGQGQDQVFSNPDALGAAWFVKAVRFENGASEVMNALSNFNPRDTAVLFAQDKAAATNFNSDSAASIRLLYNDNDEAAYVANSATGGFAVFSEVYYSKGWKAFVDGKETPIIRTNYVLRGINIPAGQHQVFFQFRPSSYYTGNTISLIAGLLVFVLIAAAIWHWYRHRNKAVDVK